MAKYYTDSSPSPQTESPLALIQPRHRHKTSYVQRWKVLRDRNKNLPKLDFNVKSPKNAKKLQAAPSFSRSYTYDSMKLPSISTSSVVTGFSGKSVHSDGYRRRDKERNLQDQHSDSYTDLSILGTQREFDMNSTLSKSLQNIVDASPRPPNKDADKDKSKHRFERISYQKHLSNRSREKSTLERIETKRQNTMMKEHSIITQEESKKAAISKLQKDSLEQIQRRIGTQNLNGVKQYLHVKESRKDSTLNNYPTSLSSITTTSTVKRKNNDNSSSNQRADSKTSPHTFATLITTSTAGVHKSPSDTITLTPDGASVRSLLTAGMSTSNSDNENN